MILEGTYEGFWTDDTVRVDIVSHPGPPPYTKTSTSVTSWVADQLQEIGMGKKVRITVEEVK